MEYTILAGCLIILAIACFVLSVKLQKAKSYTEGDQWNHKGRLHITKTEDGTYLTLELYNEQALSEIEQNGQAIFYVVIHDHISR